MDTTNVMDEIPTDIARFFREHIRKEADWAEVETKRTLEMLSVADSLQKFSYDELIEIIEVLQYLIIQSSH